MRPAPFGWRRGAAYAVLWAGATSVTELAAVAGRSPIDESLALVILGVFPAWMAPGMIIVAFAAWALPRLSPLALAAATPLVCAMAAWAYPGFEPLAEALVRATGVGRRTVAEPAFMLWMTLFYGGLFIGIVALAHRAERTRALLGRAEIARSRGEELLREAELSVLRGSVDPQLVLRVLHEVQRRFDRGAHGTERLLDRLVALLRLAMPAVRSGASTLGAELSVVRAFEQVAIELDARRPRWNLRVDGVLAGLSIPPLLLLPLLERLGLPLSLRGRRVGDRAELRIEAPPGALDAELMYRLQVGLQALHGAGVRVRTHSGSDSLVLLIDVPASETPDDHSPRGAAPWTTIPATT